MRAIILAAGRGSRLNALTDDKPKCFLEVSGISLIQRQVDCFTAVGIDQISVVVGYQAKMFNQLAVTKIENKNWQQTEIFGSLLCAKNLLSSEECIVSYSDIIFEKSILHKLKNAKGHINVAYDINWEDLWTRRFDNPLDDAESFKIDERENIVEIGKKANSTKEIMGQYMGLIKFTPDGWNEIYSFAESLKFDNSESLQLTQLLQLLIERKNKYSVQGVAFDGKWAEIDDEYDLRVASKIFEDHQ